MPLSIGHDVVAPRRLRVWLRRVLHASCGLAVAASSLTVIAADDVPPSNSLGQSLKLRMEARLAAEQGDFAGAAEKLEDAALMVGDRTTAGKAQAAQKQFEAGGGAQVDFQTLITLIQEQTAPPALWTDLGDDPGGTITEYFQGVFIGAPGIASALAMKGDDSRLLEAASLVRTANQNEDVRAASSLRLVSLPRLEAHVLALQAAGESIPDDVANLAGLTRVQFLFVFPDTGDIVIGGPASDWTITDANRSVSVSDGRPTLQFDDLVTLSRTFSSGGAGFLMCSIDPKPEQVVAVREFAARKQGLTAGNARQFTQQLEEMLGLQNVIVQGVPDDSRVAKVIVEADYEMKRIGIGEREGAPQMKSYFDLAGRDERRGAAMDALRWWMTVGYDSIHVSPDRHAFEFAGQTVQCQSENQVVGVDGHRMSTGKADKANEKFASLFTQHLPALAQTDVVFADLQNVFDLSLAMALVHGHGFDRETGWKPAVLGNDGRYQPAPVDVPDELMTAANCRVYRGGEIVIQVAGGVRADLRSIVQDPATYETTASVEQPALMASPIGQSGRWWWDAAPR